MTDQQTDEIGLLRIELEILKKKARELNHRRNQIEARLMALKWETYPIGSRVYDDKQVEYQVGGYDNNWMLGYRIKKDGTPGSRMVPFQPVKLA